MKITNVATVNMLEVIRELQTAEWNALGLDPPDVGHCVRLPDGGEDCHQRIWDLIMKREWGNQTFTNDSFYRFTFEWEVPMEPDELMLYNHVKEAVFEHCGIEMVLFDVSW